MPPGSSPRATLGSDGRIPDLQLKLRPVRSSDLAQITGRPRETIRRKLERMRKQGRVQRVRGGWVYEASSIDADLQALALGSVSRFLATADILRSAARAADDAGPVNVGHRGTR
jgi:DNA-binding IclR family transcriptional regulator